MSSVHVASGGFNWTQIVQNVEWTARGELKSYQAWMPDTWQWVPVTYGRGTDGRLTSLTVGTKFEQTYDYTERTAHGATDQLTSICTRYADLERFCQKYVYDKAERIQEYNRVLMPSEAPLHLPVTWDWDARGNPTNVNPGAGTGSISFSYAAAPRADELMFEKGAPTGTQLRSDFLYDLNGRTSQISWPVDSSGQPAGLNLIGYDGNSSAIGDSAIRSVSVKGALFQYVYDERQRRRAKVYPWSGGMDSFSYSITNPVELQQDIADARWDAKKIEDTYVWLGGRPIAVVRGAYDASWQHLADSELDCSRGGEGSDIPCGLRHIVTDYSPKPVLALNRAGAIVGVGEYPPFGEMNTRQLRGESAHPYLRPTAETALASWNEPMMGLTSSWRLNFDSFDTEDWFDPVMLKDNGVVVASWTGHHRGHHRSGWVATSSNNLAVTFSADWVDCSPAPNWCATWDWNYSGVAVRSAEYTRSEPGVAQWFPPIRFPGQYRDEETGLHENWNRFYDPGGGRYLALD